MFPTFVLARSDLAPSSAPRNCGEVSARVLRWRRNSFRRSRSNSLRVRESYRGRNEVVRSRIQRKQEGVVESGR